MDMVVKDNESQVEQDFRDSLVECKLVKYQKRYRPLNMTELIKKRKTTNEPLTKFPSVASLSEFDRWLKTQMKTEYLQHFRYSLLPTEHVQHPILRCLLSSVYFVNSTFANVIQISHADSNKSIRICHWNEYLVCLFTDLEESLGFQFRQKSLSINTPSDITRRLWPAVQAIESNVAQWIWSIPSQDFCIPLIHWL